jgi:ankyrin repeat protein
MVKLLLERGTDPKVRSKPVKLLLERGTDPKVRSKPGVTALDLAKEYKNADVVSLLETVR